jgi:hypothetical protein
MAGAATDISKATIVAAIIDFIADMEVDIVSLDHGKTILSLGGSHNTTTTKSLVAAVASKKTKSFSLTLSTVDITADNVAQITDGSGGTVLYQIEFGSGVQGVAKHVTIPSYLFETTANTALHLKLSAAQKVTYSLSYYQEA